MSGLHDLRGIARRRGRGDPGPLAKPAELAPVVRKKAEPTAYSSLSRVGPKRGEKKARQFGEQAARCRLAPCACCGLKGFSEPHHWPTVGAGGKDRDTVPLCGGLSGCHAAFHAAGSPEAFLGSHGCDVLAEIDKMRRKPDHRCEAFARLVEREPGLVSFYRCERCGYVLPDEDA